MPREIADPDWERAFEFDEPEADVDLEAMAAGIIRDHAQRAVRLISSVVDEMPDSPEKWGIAFAVGAGCCVGRSMSEVAAKLGVTRALISTRAVSFCKRYDLPPSPYMRG